MRYHIICSKLGLQCYERSLSDSSLLPKVPNKQAVFHKEIEKMRGNELMVSDKRDIKNKQDEV